MSERIGGNFAMLRPETTGTRPSLLRIERTRPGWNALTPLHAVELAEEERGECVHWWGGRRLAVAS